MKRGKTEIKGNQRPFSVGIVSNGVVAWLFGVSGPLFMVLQSAAKAGLSMEITSSWIFAVYFTGGLLTVILSVYYRQPLAFAFSIPGAVLVGTSLETHSFSTIVGAYMVTGVVVLLVGLSGTVERIMKRIPLPIMMGMVSGVLFPFGTDLVRSILESPVINGLTFLTFLGITFFAFLARRIPPILGALVISILLLSYFGDISFQSLTFELAKPHLFLPEFDLSVCGELVIPLAITVIAIQNAQGIGVLKGANYQPPINAMTNWSGIGSIINSLMGAHSACVAGPMTAILTQQEKGSDGRHYISAVVMGLLWILFGILAPMAVHVTQAIPSSLIRLLGGLAMIGVLAGSVQMSFSAQYKLGALFAFMITVSNITLWHIGSPFWGLVGGIAISLILDKQDWRERVEAESKPIRVDRSGAGETAR